MGKSLAARPQSNDSFNFNHVIDRIALFTNISYSCSAILLQPKWIPYYGTTQLEKMVKTINFGPFVSDDIFSENSPDASNNSLSQKFLQELTIFYFLFLSQGLKEFSKFKIAFVRQWTSQ